MDKRAQTRKTIDWKQYQSIVVYGIGQYYEVIKEELFHYVKPDYLCDRKWDDCGPGSYDGIPIMKREELYRLEHTLVIITIGAQWMTNSVKSDLENISGIYAIHVEEILNVQKTITGKMLKEFCGNGCYQDERGNCIQFDETIPDSIKIYFEGKHNTLIIGKNVLVDKLMIVFGNEGTCYIGEGTHVLGGSFLISDASLNIGKDCLLSSEIIIRTHDHHHIFDVNTHKRINYPRDVVIGEHVWIGYRVSLLAGAKIGRGSVVGTGAVTSGQFGEHQIIAGCPAKVTREHVCWSKDSTDIFNHGSLEECIFQEALKYL